MVSFKRLVQPGRIVFISSGKYAKKIAMIVEIVDQNRVIVDGPFTGVPRHQCGIKQIQLTKLAFQLPHGSKTNVIEKVWNKNDVTAKWNDTVWARKLERKRLRASMSDFDRFKVMVARQTRNRILQTFKISKMAGVRKMYKRPVKN